MNVLMLVIVATLSFIAGDMFKRTYYEDKIDEMVDNFKKYDRARTKALECAVQELLQSMDIEISNVRISEE